MPLVADWLPSKREISRRLGNSGSAVTVFLHWLIWRHPRQSVSSRAWDKRAESHLWWAVVVCLTHEHCRRSFHWHRVEVNPWDFM